MIEIAAPHPKRTRRADRYDCVGISPEIKDRCDPSTSYEIPRQSDKASSTTDVIELDKEVNLFVTVFVERGSGKTGRFMSILRVSSFLKVFPFRLSYSTEMLSNRCSK